MHFPPPLRIIAPLLALVLGLVVTWFATVNPFDLRMMNAEGVESFSPRLRGTSYLGSCHHAAYTP